MPMPKTRDELVKAGYVFDRHGVCRGATCKREVEWWRSPAERPMPFDLMQNGDSPAVAHFTTCPDREAFKK